MFTAGGGVGANNNNTSSSSSSAFGRRQKLQHQAAKGGGGNGRKTQIQQIFGCQKLPNSADNIRALFPSLINNAAAAVFSHHGTTANDRAALVLLERDALLRRASGGFRLFVHKFTDQQLIKCLRTPALNTLSQWAPPNLRYIHVLRNAWKKLTQFERFDWQEQFEQQQLAKNGTTTLDISSADDQQQPLEGSASARSKDEQRMCQFQWLSTVDAEHLPCPLCSFGSPRRYTIGQLLAHLSLSHHSAHLYACHCCSTAFSNVEALKEHGASGQCRAFLRYMREHVGRMGDELIFDFTYASLICAECGVHVLLSPRCDQDKLANTLLNIILSHSNQSLALCLTYASVELPNPFVNIQFLRPVIFEPVSKCEFCLRSGWNSPMELERHCVMEHSQWAMNNGQLLQCHQCTAKFFTAPMFCDHLLSVHLHSVVPLVTQFLRTVPQFPAALDKSGTVIVGTVGIDRMPSSSSLSLAHGTNFSATADNPLKWVPAAERAARDGKLRRSKRKPKRRRLHTPAPEDDDDDENAGGAAAAADDDDEEEEDDFDADWDDETETAPAASSKKGGGRPPSRSGGGAAREIAFSQQNYGRLKTKMRLLEARSFSSGEGQLAKFVAQLQLPVQRSVGQDEFIVQNTLDGALLTESVYKCSDCNAIVFGESSITDHIIECHQIERKSDEADFEQMLNEYVFDNVEVLFDVGNFPFTRIRCDLCQNDCCSVVSLRRHYAQCHGILCAFQPNRSTVYECAAALLRHDWANTGFDRELLQQINSSLPPRCTSEMDSECTSNANLDQQFGPIELNANALYKSLVHHQQQRHDDDDNEHDHGKKNSCGDEHEQQQQQIVEECEQFKDEPMAEEQDERVQHHQNHQQQQTMNVGTSASSLSFDKTSADGDLSTSALSTNVQVKEELNDVEEEQQQPNSECFLQSNNFGDNDAADDDNNDDVDDDYRGDTMAIVGADAASSSSPFAAAMAIKNELSPNSSPTSNATFADLLHRSDNTAASLDGDEDSDDDDDKKHKLVIDDHEDDVDEDDDASDQHQQEEEYPTALRRSARKRRKREHGSAVVVDYCEQMEDEDEEEEQKAVPNHHNHHDHYYHDDHSANEQENLADYRGEDGEDNDSDDGDGDDDATSDALIIARLKAKYLPKRRGRPPQKLETIIRNMKMVSAGRQKNMTTPTTSAKMNGCGGGGVGGGGGGGRRRRNGAAKKGGQRRVQQQQKKKKKTKQDEDEEWMTAAVRQQKRQYTKRKSKNALPVDDDEDDDDNDDCGGKRKKESKKKKQQIVGIGDKKEENESCCSSSTTTTNANVFKEVAVTNDVQQQQQQQNPDEVEMIMKGMERHFHRKRGRPKKKKTASWSAASSSPKVVAAGGAVTASSPGAGDGGGPSTSSAATAQSADAATGSSAFVCFMCTAVEKNLDAFGQHLRLHPEQWKRCTICTTEECPPNDNTSCTTEECPPNDNTPCTTEECPPNDNTPCTKEECPSNDTTKECPQNDTTKECPPNDNMPTADDGNQVVVEKAENKSKKRRNFDHPVHFLKHLIECHMNFEQNDRVQCPWCEYFIQFSLADQRYRASAAMFRHMVYECVQSDVCLLCGHVCPAPSSPMPQTAAAAESSSCSAIVKQQQHDEPALNNNNNKNGWRNVQLIRHRYEEHQLIFDRFICLSCKCGFYSREQFLHHTCELTFRCVCNSSFRFLCRDDYTEHLQRNANNLKKHSLMQTDHELDIGKRTCMLNRAYRHYVNMLDERKREEQIERETAKAVAAIKQRLAHRGSETTTTRFSRFAFPPTSPPPTVVNTNSSAALGSAVVPSNPISPAAAVDDSATLTTTQQKTPSPKSDDDGHFKMPVLPPSSAVVKQPFVPSSADSFGTPPVLLPMTTKKRRPAAAAAAAPTAECFFVDDTKPKRAAIESFLKKHPQQKQQICHAPFGEKVVTTFASSSSLSSSSFSPHSMAAPAAIPLESTSRRVADCELFELLAKSPYDPQTSVKEFVTERVRYTHCQRLPRDSNDYEARKKNAVLIIRAGGCTSSSSAVIAPAPPPLPLPLPSRPPHFCADKIGVAFPKQRHYHSRFPSVIAASFAPITTSGTMPPSNSSLSYRSFVLSQFSRNANNAGSTTTTGTNSSTDAAGAVSSPAVEEAKK